MERYSAHQPRKQQVVKTSQFTIEEWVTASDLNMVFFATKKHLKGHKNNENTETIFLTKRNQYTNSGKLFKYKQQNVYRSKGMCLNIREYLK